MNIVNRKVSFDYNILTTFEAGIQLLGPEVKVLRLNSGSVMGSYCQIRDNEVFVINMHIPNYKFTKIRYDEYRMRKLLLHKSEINKLVRSYDQHMTIVPMEVYFNSRGYAKIKIGLCEGKKTVDKRKSIKAKENQKEKMRALKKYLKA